MRVANAITIDLGFIGHHAEKLEKMFNEHSKDGNEYGYFLRFQNYSELVVNKGVLVHTNCFESEEDFEQALMSKLLFSL